MSASANDKITQSMNGGSPVVTTVSSARSIGGTSLSAVALTNWPTATRVFFTTYKKKTDGTKDFSTVTSWWAIVSGTTLGTLTRVGGAADAGNAVGDYIEMGPTAGWAEGLYEFGTAIHNTDGTLKDGIVATAKIADSAITTTKLLDANVTTAKLADGSVTPAKLQSGTGSSWTPTDYSGSATVVGWSSTTTKQIRYIQTGKVVKMFIYITGTSNSTSTTISLPVAPSTHLTFFEAPYALAQDNGSFKTAAPRYSIDNSSGAATIVTFYTDTAGTTWTASGTKSIRAMVQYEAA